MSSLFKNSLLVEVLYLLISFIKTKSILWNTKNTDRNCVNKQNTHTAERDRETETEREENNSRKG